MKMITDIFPDVDADFIKRCIWSGWLDVASPQRALQQVERIWGAGSAGTSKGMDHFYSGAEMVGEGHAIQICGAVSYRYRVKLRAAVK